MNTPEQNEVTIVGSDTVSDLRKRIEELTKENDMIRGITARLMPCHYCGVDSIEKCPSGFPGCALADDLMCADDCANKTLREAQKRIEELEAGASRMRSALMKAGWHKCGCPGHWDEHSCTCYIGIALSTTAGRFPRKTQSNGGGYLPVVC